MNVTLEQSSRERLLDTTSDLLAERGYHGLAVKEILEGAGSSAASLYHHFPQGKEQMAAVAVTAAGVHARNNVEHLLARRRCPDAIESFFMNSAEKMERSDYTFGCPVGTPASDTVNSVEPVRVAAGEALRSWAETVEMGLRRDGATKEVAVPVSRVVVALYEGALLMARSMHDADIMREAARSARSLAEAALAG